MPPPTAAAPSVQGTFKIRSPAARIGIDNPPRALRPTAVNWS
ncbi:hypothetical protein ACP70R_013307 [Stipagrostis hirtigluma subsp. patula]